MSIVAIICIGAVVLMLLNYIIQFIRIWRDYQ